jgi:hypothetical protein
MFGWVVMSLSRCDDDVGRHRRPRLCDTLARGHPKRYSDAVNGDSLMVNGENPHCVADNRSDL